MDLPPAPVTRFAPSPTGYLHLGHVANAVWTWGAAAAAGGTVLLRIEDHDRGRCRPTFEAAILEDLEWLGLEPDATSRASLARAPSPFRQSDNEAAYAEAVTRLSAGGTVYGCRCSRAAIAEAMGALGDGGGEELRYPGTCRPAGLAPGPGLGTRLLLDPVAIAFDDIRLGRQVQVPATQCGDLLLRDPLGNWTYQLAVTVDDLRHGVTLVVRGEDLLPSTGRQLLLARRLGRVRPPAYLHHPLIRDGEGAKLSKRDGATGIRALRAAGRSPEEVLGEAAFRTGLLASARPVAADELGGLFA